MTTNQSAAQLQIKQSADKYKLTNQLTKYESANQLTNYISTNQPISWPSTNQPISWTTNQSWVAGSSWNSRSAYQPNYSSLPIKILSLNCSQTKPRAKQPIKHQLHWISKVDPDSQGERNGLHPFLSLVLCLGKEGEGHPFVMFDHDEWVVPLHTGKTQSSYLSVLQAEKKKIQKFSKKKSI